MFNLIMRHIDWNDPNASMPVERMFEYTDPAISAQFQLEGEPLLDRLAALPCLLMPEGRQDETCRIGSVIRPKIVNGEIRFRYTLDPDVPPLTNKLIWDNRDRFDMPQDFEFSRNHWAVKELDIYQFLLGNIRPRRQRPSVFQIAEHEAIEQQLVSVMMPFDAGFNNVYAAIQQAAGNCGLRSRRADEIWEAPGIIQDVVNLIDRARIVICDCTNRNPNVFYEAGIAHTLGREVIIITQNAHDVPFDLQHLRYVHYLNNNEGLVALTQALQGRMQTLLGH
jgi:hypothetical protein